MIFLFSFICLGTVIKDVISQNRIHRFRSNCLFIIEINDLSQFAKESYRSIIIGKQAN